MKSILLFICLVGAITISNATDCEGYIITSTGDTVRGTVDVSIKKALIGKKEIDFGDMEMKISFTEKGEKKKKFKAGEIAGYGFYYEGEWYHFEVLDIQKNFGQKAPKLLGKVFNDFRFFVYRVYDGQLPIYKNYWNSENQSKDPASGEIRATGTSQNYDLYVKNKEYGFVEIAPTTLGGNKKLKEFLKKYLKLEDDFLKTVDDKAKFSDAEDILKRYNDWKKANS